MLFHGCIENGNTNIYVVDSETEQETPLTHIPYHSPDGFAWGYQGSGPADAALAILAAMYGETKEDVLKAIHHNRGHQLSKALKLHQNFKDDFLAMLSMNREWYLSDAEISAWLEDQGYPVGTVIVTEEVITEVIKEEEEDNDTSDVDFFGYDEEEDESDDDFFDDDDDEDEE